MSPEPSQPPSIKARLASLILFILIWLFLSFVIGVNRLILPTPFDVILSARDIGWDLVIHTFSTFARAITGFLTGVLVGLLIGLSIKFNHVLASLLEPILDSMRPVPTIALLPFFILIFGFSETGRASLAAISVSIVIAVAVIEAIVALPEHIFRIPIINKKAKFQIYSRVVVPAILPNLIGPMRVGIAISYTIVIAAEFMGAQNGLGYIINAARVNLATPSILLCILILGILAQLSEVVFINLVRQQTKWHQRASKIFSSA